MLERNSNGLLVGEFCDLCSDGLVALKNDLRIRCPDCQYREMMDKITTLKERLDFVEDAAWDALMGQTRKESGRVEEG